MDISRLSLDSGDLALSLCTLLELRHLLSLYGRCGDFLTQDDVTNLTGGERRNIDTVTFTEVLWQSVNIN